MTELKIELNSLRAEICKKDYYRFIQEFWETVITEKPVWNWHIKAIADKLQAAGEKIVKREAKGHDMILNIPPGTSKTTICTILFPCWLWAVDPTLTILTASYSAELSLNQSSKSRDVILSEKYQKYFPHVKLKDDRGAKGNFETTKNGARITTSTGGKATGVHANVIILDDPQTFSLANSEAERNNTNEWFDGTLPTRKVEDAPIILVQQRLHAKDLTGYLLNKEKVYDHICLPAESSDLIRPIEWKENYREGLLDPARLHRDKLKELKVDLGTRNFNTQIGQNPQDGETSIIKPEWLPTVTKEYFKEKCARQQPVINFYIDPAYTAKSSNDPSAVLACSKVNGVLYILGCAEVWLEFPQFIQFLYKYTAENGRTQYSRIKIEPTASGKPAYQVLKKSSLNISEYSYPSKSKIERLHGVAPKVEAGKVAIVEGSWNSLFKDQVTANSPNHDDIRDCFVMAIEDQLIKRQNGGKYTISLL